MRGGVSSSRHWQRWQLAVALILLAVSYGVGFVRTTAARQTLIASPTRPGRFLDGTYSGWGRSPHGRIQSTVVIRRGRIVTVEITSCRTRYPCSMISALPAQVIERQSPAVDIVSGATHSSQALSRAVEQALLAASRETAP
jgi:uncharacterized protein with FMN-binding domain